MASSATDKDDIATSLSSLQLDDSPSKPAKKPAAKTAPPKKKQKEKVVDSWEDEDVSSAEDEAKPHSSRGSSPTPPTPPRPKSPELGPMQSWGLGPDAPSSRPAPDGGPARRPEKTDAVARRMIAAGLGLKAPKQTEEQRAYQRSIREQEKRRRDEERAAEQKRVDEANRAKAAMWDD
ncbi:hypothetical protein HIM_02564 [Hirsutella minnesotensis 3608]|nr:hypothetical protein HIM_02564 [Hirsutella minnesotensis 3608]